LDKQPAKEDDWVVVSRNLVELVRRHHEQGAPTALDVLKEAMDQNGEITDDDRRLAAERSGLPEATVHGVSTFYEDLLVPRGRRHVRVCTGTACFAATGDAHVDELAGGLGLSLGERSDDGSLPRLLPRLARRARRRRDRRRPGRDRPRPGGRGEARP
jgi:NADH:ubiquinone oxidoreductase subunit E